MYIRAWLHSWWIFPTRCDEPYARGSWCHAHLGWQEHNDFKFKEDQGHVDLLRKPHPRAAPTPLTLTTCGEMIERVSSFKLLGVWQQDNLKWNTHIEKIARNSSKSLFYLRECRRINLPTEVGIMCYQTKIRSLLESTNLGRDPTISS